MSLRVLELEQRTPEWFAARCGIVTASAIGSLITANPADALSIACPSCSAVVGESCISAARKVPTPIKTPHTERTAAAAKLPPVYAPADNDTSRGLINSLAAERVTNNVEETWTSRDMERGIFAEPYARDLYSKHHAPAVECGFMIRDFGDYCIGYSPDGLVGDDGLIEIKAPRQKGHLATVISGEIPHGYMAQCQTGLLVSGRKWCDFLPYVGGMPLWHMRVLPDEHWFAAITKAAEQAEKAIAETVAKYERAVAGLPVTPRIDFDMEMTL
jgi:hypothetical protein